MSKLLPSPVHVLLLAAAALAEGAQAQVSCSVAGVSDLGVNFGNYTGVVKNVNSPGTLQITCTNNGDSTRYIKVCLGLGAGSGGDEGLSGRVMKNGSNKLYYQLFRNSARTQVYGTYPNNAQENIHPLQIKGFGMTLTQDTQIRLYGRVFGAQSPAVGAYASDFTSSNIEVKWKDYDDLTAIPAGCPAGMLTMSGSPTFSVKANVPTSCSIILTPTIDFGTRIPPLASDLTASGILRVKCNKSYTIAANPGDNAAAGVRRMRRGTTADYIRYELHRNATHNAPWGSDQSQRFSGTASGNYRDHYVYGIVKKTQNAGALAVGEYTDKVVVTLEY